MDSSDFEIQVDVHSGAAAPLREYARAKVGAVLRHTSQPVLYARINLDQADDPTGQRPTQASVEVDLNGTVLLAKAEAPTPTEAIDLMKDRLSARLARSDTHRHHRSTLPHTPSTATTGPELPRSSAASS